MSDPIIISYSEVMKFQTCKRQWYYRFFLGLKPPEESAAISTGIKGHDLLKYFYNGLVEGLSKEEAHAQATKKASKAIAESGLLDFPLAFAWTLVDNYIRETDFTAKAVLIENRFLVPASRFTDDPELQDVQIGFTPDVVFERTGGYIDVEDSKFVQRAWNSKKIERFQQVRLYQIFLEAMGYKISRGVIRFFNVKTGKISVSPYTPTPTEKSIVIHDFLDGAKDVIRHRRRLESEIKKSSRTLNYTACQFCSFVYVCSREAEGKDMTKTFNTQYVKNNYDYAN